jgi:aminobenzoyl-glutamate utilization protein B
LAVNGFSLEKGVAGIDTAFVASWGSGQPVIGFVEEYDALPGLSQARASTEIEPITEGAPGHGCGHNLFGAASATAAIATAKAMSDL